MVIIQPKRCGLTLAADLLVTCTRRETCAKAASPSAAKRPGTSGALGVSAPDLPRGPAKWKLKRSVSPWERFAFSSRVVIPCIWCVFLFKGRSCSFAAKFNDRGLVKKKCRGKKQSCLKLWSKNRETYAIKLRGFRSITIKPRRVCQELSSDTDFNSPLLLVFFF